MMGIERAVAQSAHGRQEAVAWAMGGAPPHGVALMLRKYGGAGNAEMLVLTKAALAEAELLADQEGWPLDKMRRGELRSVALVVLHEVLSARLCEACAGHGQIVIGDKLIKCPLAERRRLPCIDGIRPWSMRDRAAMAHIEWTRFRRSGWAGRYTRLLQRMLRWEQETRERMLVRMRG